MRKLSKGTPHETIKEFEGQNEWTRSSHFHRMWRKFILTMEQKGLSGYTEAPLRIEDSHIDHFYKRSLFRDMVHSWDNLVVDTIDETYGAKYKDRHVKITDDNLKLINPVTEDPSRFFRYKVDGRIVSRETLSEVERERANYTITAFNLNDPSLVERRRTLLSIDINAYGDVTLEQLKEWLNDCGFPSVVEQIYNER